MGGAGEGGVGWGGWVWGGARQARGGREEEAPRSRGRGGERRTSVRGGQLVHPLGQLLHTLRHLLAHQSRRLGGGDVLIVIAELGLRRRREERRRQPRAPLQPARQDVPTHRARRLVIRPARACDVPADDRFDRQHLQPTHEHRAPLEQRRVAADTLGHLIHLISDEVVLKSQLRRGEVAQPEACQLCQHLALARNAVQHHHIERRDAVGRDDEQRLRVDFKQVAHLPLA